MLIDNKIDRYPGAGLGIVTVWDFLQKYAGIASKQEGEMDIVTGYFTIRAQSFLKTKDIFWNLNL